MMTDVLMGDVLIAVATPMEIAPFLSLCTVTEERRHHGGGSVITARFHARTFKVILTGPGMVNTAMALGSHLACHRPGLIIQTGIAGFFKSSGLTMGGIGIATAETCIHNGVEKTDGTHELTPLPFSLTGSPMESGDGQVAMHPGIVQSTREMIAEAFSSGRPVPGKNPLKFRYPRSCPVVSGPFITVSTITAAPKTVTQLEQTHTPVMEAMEGMASAQVTCRYGVPFLEIRSGSNPVGLRDKTAWDIPLAVTHLSMALAAIFDRG